MMIGMLLVFQKEINMCFWGLLYQHFTRGNK